MKTAFIFPGQGSQSVGMGRDLAENHLDRASSLLGFDLKKICLEGPAEELIKTEIQQPAIFTVSAAIFEKLGQKPDAVAGHSLGEYSALYAAGSLSFEDGVRLVHLRGKFMQEAVPPGEGAMVAVLGGDRNTIQNICQEVGNVWPANFNSPGQVVISGKKEAVAAAGARLKQAGIKRIIPLAVSAPFHCPLMQPAADKLAVELNRIQIKDPQIAFVANVTADYARKAEEIKALLIKQVTSSVLWEDSINRLINDGVSHFIEAGPGNVLAGLVSKINPTVEVRSFSLDDKAKLR
jgi:[acyl-carrier-protein] S-malonyltransferase